MAVSPWQERPDFDPKPLYHDGLGVFLDEDPTAWTPQPPRLPGLPILCSHCGGFNAATCICYGGSFYAAQAEADARFSRLEWLAVAIAWPVALGYIALKGLGLL